MTDTIVANPIAHKSSAASKTLVAKRHAAERRFQFMGLAAIALTGIFLVYLIADIVSRGIPAFTENRLVLDVSVDADKINPQNSSDPAVIRAGDFDALIRGAVRDALPSISSRGDRKLLNGLLSTGAADDLRSAVVADPSLVGTTVKITALLSDDADQYLKGKQTAVLRTPGTAALTITPDGDLIQIAADDPVFAPLIADVQQFIGKELARRAPELARIEASVGDLERSLKLAEERIAAASGDEVALLLATTDRDRLAADLQALTSARDALKVTSENLARRLDASATSQQLGPELPSLLIEAGGGVFKLTDISAATATAEPVLPIAAAAIPAGEWSLLQLTTPESGRRTGDKEAAWLESLKSRSIVESGFAWRFFTSGDSREAELAGIKGALAGSALTLIVTLLICLPLGVGAAIYLEEFAPKNKLTDLIEININNLAAVPSIVFGLLGLAVFLNFFDLPRSAPLVGGLVLALLVLPTIIIASRAALKAVPPSIKEAALGVGASHQQAIFHHVLPLAIPGIMTGTIIGMAHALGETAPLLMIGMVAFIVDVPQGITEAATAMPVQIYLWSDLPEAAFQAKTAAAIIVLLVFLFIVNAAAILVRKRFERRW